MITRLIAPKGTSIAFSLAFTVALSLWGSPTLAGDPFRNSNSRDIGEKTEAAFEAIFREGNYLQAKRYLIEADESETKEPLAHALRASLAYTEKDWETLKTYASKTLQTADSLKFQDPLRGNLYLAVGHFLEGTYIFKTEGPIGAIAKLPQVFEYFDEAENNADDDPELNLLKGYMDLLLAVNLPFSSPEQAIERLENYAAPDYLVDRGIAVAYRDLDRLDEALEFVERAIQNASENPELYYLKGQILRQQGRKENARFLLMEALAHFDRALEKAEQLPESVLKTLRRERRKTQKKIDELSAYSRWDFGKVVTDPFSYPRISIQ